MGLAVLTVALLIAAVLPAQKQAAQAQTPAAGTESNDDPFADDPGVVQAQSDLAAAREQLRAISSRLDVLAADFEQSRAHVQQLTDDLQNAPERIDQAEQSSQQARSARAEQVRAAYMHPGLDFTRMSSAFLLAPDVNTALHTTAVMQRVAAAKAREAESQMDAGQRVIDDVNNQRQIISGTSIATSDLEELTTTFTAALDVATADLTAAEAALAAARDNARQLAQQEAERAQQETERAQQAELAQQQAELAQQQQAAPQQTYMDTFGEEIIEADATPIRIATINGQSQEMACPLGQPNGFTDSWGFPRSGGRTHKGVDMFASYGMPVFAAADGVVRRVYNNTLGGLSIDLVDGLGHRYYYAHLSAAYVSDGQQVLAGELLAANGNSGNAISTPPHVHWQFHPNDGEPVNPFPLAAALCR